MSKTLKYSTVMFLAGVCYGFNVPLVRFVYAQGFSASEVMIFQYSAATVFLAIIIVLFFRRRVTFKDIMKLFCVGFLAAGVSFSYYRALALLPSATAVTLLFQFVWMGLIAQALRERKLPNKTALFSVLIVMLGTVLATGILEVGATSDPLNPLGIFFGLLSAAFYAAFIIASSKTATQLPAANRTLFTSIGSFFVAFILCPTFFNSTLPSAITNPGFILPGLALGIAGILLPVFLIASSSPHLPNGLSTIMASSELPSGILCAALFMGDAISPLVALGVVIVLAGIALSQSPELLAHLKNRKTKR